MFLVDLDLKIADSALLLKFYLMQPMGLYIRLLKLAYENLLTGPTDQPIEGSELL